MHDESKLIEFLRQEGGCSGSVIGEALGISRMTVQKRIQALADNGLPVSAQSGVGYVLQDGVSLLHETTITKQFIPSIAQLIDSVEVFQSIESTNSYLLSRPIQLAKAQVCLAEAQSAGRGRRGNDWQSSPYRNIMMSISWGFDHWPATITGLSLAVGLVVAEYLNSQHRADVSIKWPNDLLVGRDKLGGILVDVSGESSGVCNVVIGLGLNVHQPDWSTEPNYRWQDLVGLGIEVDRNVLAADLCSVIVAMLSRYVETGFAPMIDRWNQLSSYANKQITVSKGEQRMQGMMAGVDAAGALLLEVAGDVIRIDDSSSRVRLVEA